MTFFATLRNDERGITGIQLVALIIAPLVAVMVATAAIGMMRTGTGLVDSFQRSSVLSIVAGTFTSSIEGATRVVADDAQHFTAVHDPRFRPPGDVRETAPSVCVEFEWDIQAEGALETLRVERVERTGKSCTSPEDSRTVLHTLTGLQPGAAFAFSNSSARPMVFTAGVPTFGAGTKPSGITPTAWSSPSIAQVHLSAVAQQLVGERALELRASRWEPLAGGLGESNRMVLSIDSSMFPACEEFDLTFVAGASGTIDWGDGTGPETVAATGPEFRSHVYQYPGVHNVTLEGTFPHLTFGPAVHNPMLLNSDINCVLAVSEWGNTGTVSMEQMFTFAQNLGYVAEPPRTVENMSLAFAYSTYNHPGIATWDVSEVEDLSGLFGFNTVFNQPLDRWDPRSASSVASMFHGATALQTDISGWGLGNRDDLDMTDFATSAPGVIWE